MPYTSHQDSRTLQRTTIQELESATVDLHSPGAHNLTQNLPFNQLLNDVRQHGATEKHGEES